MRILFIFLLFCIPFNCSKSNVTGTGGEGNGSETVARGIIIDSTGAPAAGVQTHLLSAVYNPVADDTISTVLQTVTDSDGEYRFEGIGSGTYNLEAGSPANGLKALITGIECSGEKSSIDVDTTALRKTGSIIVNLRNLALHTGDYLYLPGTNTFTVISAGDSISQQIILSDVPAAIFTDLIYVSSNDTPAVNLIEDSLIIHSGDTVASGYAAWSYSAKLFLNTSATGCDVQEDVHDFPVLVRLTDEQFNFSRAQTDGKDIRFTTPRGFPLDFEIERWDPVNGLAEIWVRVDTVHGNDSMQYIAMYWGNSSADKISDGTPVFNTLNNFIGVWHMNEDPSSGDGFITDHSSNTHNATPCGSMNASNSVEGMVGKALKLDGTDDYLDAGDVSLPERYTVGFWVYLETLEHSQRFIFKDSSYTLWYDTVNVCIRMEHMDSAGHWRGIFQDDGATVPMTAGTWNFLTGTFDGTVIRLYLNSNEISTSGEIATNLLVTSTPLLFGRSWVAQFVNGIMDEIRIEGTARSPAWIKLSYMNQREDDKLIVFK